ncbi:MAG: hypothetical protein R8K50_10685 [Mariprofundus sp.]
MSWKMRMLSWLHCPSMTMLIIAALLLGVMPVTPEPHLLEKMRMLLNGTLVKTVDIFDLFWHSWPILWIVLRLLTPGAASSCSVKP